MEKLSGQNQMGAGHVRVREGCVISKVIMATAVLQYGSLFLIMAVDPYL